MLISVIVASAISILSTFLVIGFYFIPCNFELFLITAVQVLSALYSIYGLLVAIINRRKRKTIVDISCMGIIFPAISISVLTMTARGNILLYALGPIYLFNQIIVMAAYISVFNLYTISDNGDKLDDFIHSLTFGFIFARTIVLAFILIGISELYKVNLPLFISLVVILMHQIGAIVVLKVARKYNNKILHAIITFLFASIVLGILDVAFAGSEYYIFKSKYAFDE